MLLRKKNIKRNGMKICSNVTWVTYFTSYQFFILFSFLQVEDLPQNLPKENEAACPRLHFYLQGRFEMWSLCSVLTPPSLSSVIAKHAIPVKADTAKHVTPVELDTAKGATLGHCKSSTPQSSVQQWQALAHKSNRCVDPHKTVTSHRLCELQSRLPTPTSINSLTGGGPLSFEVWCPYLGTAV